MYLVLIAFLWLLLEFIYFLFHLKPLNNNEIQNLLVRGRLIKYYEAYSPVFLPANAKIDYIITQNNISEFKNYKLHRELGFFH